MLSQIFLNWKQARKWDNHCSKIIGKGEKGKAKKFKKTEILISAQQKSDKQDAGVIRKVCCLLAK